MKPSENAKDFPKHLRGQAMSLEDSPFRKPIRLDPFTKDGKYIWEEFASSTPALNPDQKPATGQIWHYLTESSSETKACWTGDPTSSSHDPASNFLASVEPAKRPLITHARRQSLPATTPLQRLGQAPVRIQPQADRRVTMPVNTEEWMDPRPYSYKPKSSMPPPNIKVDMQSIERQREFQRQGYQQSLASQLSSHSPDRPAFYANAEAPYSKQIFAPQFQMPVQPVFPAGVYPQVSPSPTDAAFPIVARPIIHPPGIQPQTQPQLQPHMQVSNIVPPRASIDPNLTMAQRANLGRPPLYPPHPQNNMHMDNRVSYQPRPQRPILPAGNIRLSDLPPGTALSDRFYNGLSREQKEKIDREKLRIAEEQKQKQMQIDQGKSVLVHKNA